MLTGVIGYFCQVCTLQSRQQHTHPHERELMSGRSIKVYLAMIFVALFGCLGALHLASRQDAKKQEGMEFPAIQNPKVEHLFCFCGDPRCPVAFEKLPQKLGIAQGHYAKLYTFGSLAPLAHQSERPHDCRCLEDQVTLATKHMPDLVEIHVVVHHECRYYAEHSLGGKDDTEKEKHDLDKIVQAVKRLAQRRIKVTGYYARFTNQGTTICIEPVVP